MDTMTIWISIPATVVPQATTSDEEVEGDILYKWYLGIYKRIFESYGYSSENVADGLLMPRSNQMDREELASAAIKLLLLNNSARLTPKVLIDCCSSAAICGPAPAYKLAASVNLKKILPIGIDGQGGAEVANALLFLQHMKCNIILSAVQRVVSPDHRIRKDGFPIADASAAIFVTPAYSKSSFRVCSVAVGQSTGDWHSTLISVLDEALVKVNLSRDAIKWNIAHRISNPFLSAARKVLPKSNWVVRGSYPNFDFGCADPLISLNEYLALSRTPQTKLGTVWFAGRFGAVGVIVLDASHT